MIAKCTCDLILTLAAAFTRKGKFVTKQDFEESLGQYCAKRAGLGPTGLASVRSLVHDEIDRLIPIHTVKVYEPLGIAKMRTEFQRIIARHRFILDEEFTPVYDDEEAGEAEEVHGLTVWMEQMEKNPTDEDHPSERGSPDPTWSEPSSVSPPHSPQSTYGMKSMNETMYHADPKAHYQPAHMAELPGTTVAEPWRGGVSELPASNGRNPWHGGVSELP